MGATIVWVAFRGFGGIAEAPTEEATGYETMLARLGLRHKDHESQCHRTRYMICLKRHVLSQRQKD